MTQEKINKMILEGASVNSIIEARLKLKSEKDHLYETILKENKLHNKFSEHTVNLPMIIFNKIFEK